MASTEPVPGVPCWVSLSARDLKGAEEFYGAVLGWTFRPGALGEEFSVAFMDGNPVAGLGELAGALHVAVAWTPYFAVANANDCAARIRERGGTVAVGPRSFGPGRAAISADRDGATFGIWEGRVPAGWSVGQGSAPAWLELRTRDAFDAAIFYAEVLQWAAEEGKGCDVAYEQERVIVREGDHTVAELRGGAIESAPDPHVRPRWHVHFCVPDVKAAAEAATETGGAVVSPPVETEGGGHRSTLRDPEGGLFTVTEGI
ncbi:VOC family protein [Streptomyces violens]|uniref:VOC family protein n=1 Tax=Streptomyces violens TaxID=66377 RepID=UPI00056CEBB1|nr:VOC family protein [Streptomyces violens]